MAEPPTDEQLLTSGDPEDFAAFYVRHLPRVERYFERRAGRDAAGDLAAETFASALVARRRFVAGTTPAAAWLYTIAARRLIDSQRRRQTETQLFQSLAAGHAGTEQAEAPGALTSDSDAELLRHLSCEQREAILAHVVEGRGYSEIAAEARASEASVRQRVSRGLKTLRTPLRIFRSAQELSRQGRLYQFGAGHRTDLASIGPRDPLDCSAAASLILFNSGLFERDRAWNTSRLASGWGSLGQGHYVTVWANDDHVWLEFKLDADHGERFDPTPARNAPNGSWLRKATGAKHDYVPRHWPDC
jgi:RNA polymerase sigma-70 factor, ECF subfamily